MHVPANDHVCDISQRINVLKKYSAFRRKDDYDNDNDDSSTDNRDT